MTNSNPSLYGRLVVEIAASMAKAWGERGSAQPWEEWAARSLQGSIPGALHRADEQVAEMFGHLMRSDECLPLIEYLSVSLERLKKNGEILSGGEELDAIRVRFVLRAYFEASTLLLAFLTGYKNRELGESLCLYYIGRRYGDPDMIGPVRSSLLYGSDSDRRGVLYRLAWSKYQDIPEVDREIISEAWCDSFLDALEKLPVEALLHPPLALKWASETGRWAVSKKLRKFNAKTLFERDQAASKGAALNEVSLNDEVSPNHYEAIPGYDLALRKYRHNLSYADLAKELGITRQAVHKRIQKFFRLARLIS